MRDPAFALARALQEGAKVNKDADKIKRLFKRWYTQELSKPGMGNTYTTYFFTIGRGPSRRVVPYGERPPHKASAPDNPPAKDSGDLLRSMGYSSQRTGSAGLKVTITCGADYARFLEFGTSSMKPRPFFRAGMRANIDNVRRIVADGIEARERMSTKE